jgi:glucan biosynthesis protein C
VKPGAGPRWAYLDQVRAWLMLLGIPYHVGLVYATRTPLHGPWLVSSPERSEALTWILDFSHTFRMPVFFVIAGFFAMRIIGRRGTGHWLRSRLVRLGVPLLASILLLSPLTMLAVSVTQAPPEGILAHWLAQMSQPGPQWIVHLWFLSDLLIFCGLFALLWSCRAVLRLEALLDRFGDALERRWILLAPAALLLLGCAATGAAGAAKLAGIGYPLWETIVPARLASFGAAFLAGALLAYRGGWLEGFTRLYPLLWLAALPLAGVQMLLQDDPSPAGRVLTVVLVPVLGVLFAQLLLSAARRWLDRETPLSRKLTEAAMTMYLVHVPLVLWLAGAMLDWRLPPLLEVAMLTILVGLASFALHRLLRRSPVLSFLFNGQRYDAGRRAEGP